jgi:hypothetical protein
VCRTDNALMTSMRTSRAGPGNTGTGKQFPVILDTNRGYYEATLHDPARRHRPPSHHRPLPASW